MDTRSRIFELLDSANMEQKELANILGLPADTVSSWRRKKSASYTKYLPQIAEVLGTTTEYLLTCSSPASVGAVRVPVLGVIPAGIPIEAVTDIVDYEEIDAAMAATGEFFGLRIKGASMEPRMREGDVVIVRKQDTAQTGDTVVVLVNGDSATVKKIKIGSDGVSLLPTNPAYDVQFYSAADVERLPVRVIGRVVELRAKY